jgi:RHS repeat-associated protein
MGVTNYYWAGDMLLGESGPNGKVDYLTDALGSVTTTVNGTGAVLNKYRYKPSGALLSKTGTAPDPKFTWVGSQGYRQTGLLLSDAYIRARHFSSLVGSWSSCDPLWPKTKAYTYVSGRPVLVTDPSGLAGGGCSCLSHTFTLTVSTLSLTIPFFVGASLAVLIITIYAKTTATCNINSDCSGSNYFMSESTVDIQGITSLNVATLGISLAALCVVLAPEAALFCGLAAGFFLAWGALGIDHIPCVYSRNTWAWINDYEYFSGTRTVSKSQVGACGKNPKGYSTVTTFCGASQRTKTTYSNLMSPCAAVLPPS